jgi:hypothetical protein
MRLFLTILEGPSPGEAKPLIATEDPAVIAAAVRELASRLEPGRMRSRVLDLATRTKPVSPEPGR